MLQGTKYIHRLITSYLSKAFSENTSFVRKRLCLRPPRRPHDEIASRTRPIENKIEATGVESELSKW